MEFQILKPQPLSDFIVRDGEVFFDSNSGQPIMSVFGSANLREQSMMLIPNNTYDGDFLFPLLATRLPTIGCFFLVVCDPLKFEITTELLSYLFDRANIKALLQALRTGDYIDGALFSTILMDAGFKGSLISSLVEEVPDAVRSHYESSFELEVPDAVRINNGFKQSFLAGDKVIVSKTSPEFADLFRKFFEDQIPAE